MRDKWYADKRDLVKWGGIMHLLDKNKSIKKVIQVAYYRKDTWPSIDFNEDKDPVNIPSHVLKHFRDINLIANLDSRIEVYAQEFSHKTRQQYTNDLCEMMKGIQEKKIVFLDPDTGLEPKKCKVENVKHCEVKQIFAALKSGDYLVFYQHKFFDSNWDEIRRSELAGSCGLSKSKIKTWKANEIANDVIFFFIEKGR
ncbi:MAG: hypothetical protein ABFD76_02775 [Smithella sp.]